MTKFEKEIKHRLYVVIKKQQQQQLTRQNARKKHTLMTLFVHLHKHEVSTVPLTVLLHRPSRSMTCTLSYIVLYLGGDDQ